MVCVPQINNFSYRFAEFQVRYPMLSSVFIMNSKTFFGKFFFIGACIVISHLLRFSSLCYTVFTLIWSCKSTVIYILRFRTRVILSKSEFLQIVISCHDFEWQLHHSVCQSFPLPQNKNWWLYSESTQDNFQDNLQNAILELATNFNYLTCNVTYNYGEMLIEK